MQFQEFVSKIKNKYPQYKDMDDAELGSRVLNKYPEYLNSIDQSSIPSPYAANEILNRGLGYDLDERKRKLMDAALNPLDQEKYKAKLYYDKKFGIDHTPTLLEQQVKLEYGRNATLQSANNLNKKASTYQFEKYNKFTQAFLINWERLKVAAKSLPEQFLVQLNQSNIGTSPMGIPNTNFIEYQKAISQNVEAVENMPSMQLLRKSAQQDAEKRDMYIQKFRNPKAQSLAKSWNEGNFKQLGSDLFDLALLELPNFINIISASLVNPALGLAYVGTISSGSRYQEGIANGESPKEAAGKANLHALAEVVFEKLGTIGLIESTIRRTAKREFTRSFVQKAVDFSREPSTEVATQITQNLVDGKNWNEGIVEAAAIGAIYGAGVNTAITLGDATRVRFQNTNQQIDEIIESDPILSETPERAELARTAFKEPSNENLTALNNDIFKEEEVIAEPTPAEIDPLADLKIQRVKDIISGKLPVQETRGTGVRFHGTTSPELIFNEAFRFGGSELNIYGGGFYTTDAADVVTGYARKGRGKDNAIYRVEEINDLNIYDMEQPINEIDTVEINKLLPDWTEPISKGESLVKVFDRMRDDSVGEQIPAVEVQEDFTLIQDYLAKTYNGMRHIGGKFFKKAPHDVIIYFNPKDDVKITRIDPIDLSVAFAKKPIQESVYQELTPVVEPTEPQELKSVEQMRREIDVTEDSFVDIQNNLEEDVNPVADELNKSRSKFVNDIMTPLLSAVEDINPQVGARLRKFEFDVHRKKRDDSREILDFVKEMNQLAKKDSYKFTQVSDMLLNGKYKKASENISNKNLKKVRNLMEKYADELESVGFDVSRQTDYFPRRVKDYEGLKDELGQEIAGKIDNALKEQQAKAKSKGYVLSSIEESKIINNVITGAYRPVGGVKPRALKERKIEEITSDISPYYYDAVDSLMIYLNEAADVIETRKLFGKNLNLDGEVININESVGEYINEISKDLDVKDQSDLISLFRTRFSYRPTGKMLQKYKTLVNLTTLGQVQNAVTQMGDMTWSVYENGFANTLKAAFGNKKITTEDLGIREVAEEFRSFNGLKTVLNKLFKFSGFRKIDQLGKETLVNSTLLEYQQQAKDGKFDRKKQERLNVLFPTKEKQQEVIQQLKDKKSTEDIDFLMFSTLLDYQPISLSNMPVKYLEMPNGRVLYTLKTFTIKQLDTYRQNGVDNIQLGIASGDKELIKRGFSDLLRLVGIFYLMNVPTDLLKDLMSNKKIYLSDTLIDNFYKLLGVSRYNVEYATRGGKKPSEVLVRTVVPPFSFIDIPAGDLVSIISNLKKGEETDISKLESWRFLPFVGRTLYYSVGKGKEKEEKKAKQKEKENKS